MVETFASNIRFGVQGKLLILVQGHQHFFYRIGCFISKGIATLWKPKGIEELTSENTPVLLTLSFTVTKNKQKINISSKYTEWDLFRKRLDDPIDLIG